MFAGHRARAPCPALSSHFQAIGSRLNDERCRVFAVRIRVRRVLRLEVHAEPHDRFLHLCHGEAAFTGRAHGMIWSTFSGVAFVAASLEALEAFIEVFAPLLRLEDEGFLLVWCWVHCCLSWLRMTSGHPTANKASLPTGGNVLSKIMSYPARGRTRRSL